MKILLKSNLNISSKKMNKEFKKSKNENILKFFITIIIYKNEVNKTDLKIEFYQLIPHFLNELET